MYKKGKAKAFLSFYGGDNRASPKPRRGPLGGMFRTTLRPRRVTDLASYGREAHLRLGTKKEGKSLPFYGGDNRARTCDLMHVKHAL